MQQSVGGRRAAGVQYDEEGWMDEEEADDDDEEEIDEDFDNKFDC